MTTRSNDTWASAFIKIGPNCGDTTVSLTKLTLRIRKTICKLDQPSHSYKHLFSTTFFRGQKKRKKKKKDSQSGCTRKRDPLNFSLVKKEKETKKKTKNEGKKSKKNEENDSLSIRRFFHVVV